MINNVPYDVSITNGQSKNDENYTYNSRNNINSHSRLISDYDCKLSGKRNYKLCLDDEKDLSSYFFLRIKCTNIYDYWR